MTRGEVGIGMRISTFWFCLRQGVVNICRNMRFSLASTAIISACIFLFCMFFCIIANIQYMVITAQSTVGITVFFEETLSGEQIQTIGTRIMKEKKKLIKEMKFTSAKEAWDSFQKEYFGENADLAKGFAEDNPLAGSASYEIYLRNIEAQGEFVGYLKSVEGVRKINYSNSAVAGLSSFNRVLALLFSVILLVLLSVAAFLIANTISVAAEFRKNENRIMRLIGATNFMIRAPFVVEGTLLGIAGALLPLGSIYVLYGRTVEYVTSEFQLLSGILQFLPVTTIYPIMVSISLILGGGLGFVVSFMTIRRHLRV